MSCAGRNHRSQPDPPRRERSRGQQHPRVANLTQQPLLIGHVIPDEQPVPACCLGTLGEIGDCPRVGEIAEVRDIDGEAHGAMLAPGTDSLDNPAGSAAWPAAPDPEHCLTSQALSKS